ncbi:MAG TPA: replicative DNA helicase [Chitinophagaceae bacterium]|nr:replicative DNA helicase [Chitinophagaceae bacterium]
MVYGKLPPQAKELEEAVLGAIMLENLALENVRELLKPDCFYVEAHQRIFAAMISLSNKSQPIDILTVAEELKLKEELELVGGSYYIARLTNAVVSSANIEAHTKILVQKYVQRELIRISGEIIRDAYEDSAEVFDLLDDAETKLFQVANTYVHKNATNINTELVKAIERIQDLRNKDEDVTGVPSGFPSLDRITYGWQNTDLIILAARPSVGKTAFALNLARNAVMHAGKQTPVAFFSLEMSAGQLIQRILSAQSEIALENIARGKMKEHEMEQLYAKGLQPLSDVPFFIDDSPGLNVFELRAKCRRLKKAHNIGLIIIDYLQLMNGSGDNRNSNREQVISNISRNLKGLAKELNVPIIALSQLSRAVETRGANKEGSKMPQLSDLRESGAIEQDADLVMFMYRQEYYGITQDEHGDTNKGETQIRIAKHRNGSLDTIHLTALLHIQKFVEKDTLGLGPSWSAVRQEGDESGAKVFLQKGSRMNDTNDFDDENEETNEDNPF